jgi:hypothetical protein
MSVAETQPLPRFIPGDHQQRPEGTPPVLSLAQRGAETPAYGTPVPPSIPSWARPRISLVKPPAPLPRREPGASMTDEERAVSAEALVYVEPTAVAPEPKPAKVVGRIGLAFPKKAAAIYTKPVGVEEMLSDHSGLAAQIQELYPAYVVWWGEHTKNFWVMDHERLRSFDTYPEMIRGMRWESCPL